MKLPRPVVIVLNLLVVVGLGVCYIEGLRLFLKEISLALSSLQPWPFYLKMAVTGGSALATCVVIFVFNRFVTRQDMLHLGICCSLFAFVYFIVVRGWLDIVGLIVSILTTPYSLFAMVAFIGLPMLFAHLLKNKSMRGFSLFFEK
jgi:hypothetical protein